MLRRSHEHHRDFRARRDAAIPTAAANRDQDRYIMITFPRHKFKMPIFLAGRRSATASARANATLTISTCAPIFIAQGGHLRPQRACSCAATSSTNALIGVGCHQPFVCRASNPHSARGTTACHFPRFRSLKAFGRRPRCKPRRRDRPASETLNIFDRGGGLCRAAHFRFAPKADVRSL